MPAMKRVSISVAMAAAATVLLVGCQVGGSGGSASGNEPTGTSAPSMSASPATTPATAAPTASGTALSNCRRPDLTVSVGAKDAGLGHRSVVLVFTNAGPTACKLHGYPNVAGLDEAGKQVAQATQTPNGYMGGLAAGAPIPTVTVAAGQQASAMVEALASAAGGCPYKKILVTAPNDTTATSLPWNDIDGCSALRVHPVVPGTSGYAAG